MKKISIITVTMNDKVGLMNTYNSIKDSLSCDVEWIVVDGISNDGTVKFLEEINCPYCRWISEQDKSMYDAMNKGILMAKGLYLQFLNAGDTLELGQEKTFLSFNHTEDIVFYNIEKRDEKNRRIDWVLPDDFLDSLPNYPSVPHQSTFVKKKLFIDNGMYSLDYKYLGDYDFFCKIFANSSCKLTYVFKKNITLVSFICNGVTFNYRLSIKLMQECISIQKKYYGRVCHKTRLMYIGKYIISFFPKHLKLANKLRSFVKLH